MSPGDSSETVLANRLRKRQRHLRRWARREGITCYRLYDRDIPEAPLIADWYDGEVVVWMMPRRSDRTPRESQLWEGRVLDEVARGLEVDPPRIHLKVRRRRAGGGQYERLARRGGTRIVQEAGLEFEVNLSDYLDTGLFLDHRITRAMVRARAGGRRFLNLFAYTGSFTVYAAAGGAAATTSVDLSGTYGPWTERNLRLNGFEPGRMHRIVRQDVFAWLEEAKRRREAYDLIVLDPPTFSRSKGMSRASLDVERDHPELLARCSRLLAPGGELLFSTNARRFLLDSAAVPGGLSVTDVTRKTIPPDFRDLRIHHCWILARHGREETAASPGTGDPGTGASGAGSGRRA